MGESQFVTMFVRQRRQVIQWGWRGAQDRRFGVPDNLGKQVAACSSII
jgi:hypothetical protein